MSTQCLFSDTLYTVEITLRMRIAVQASSKVLFAVSKEALVEGESKPPPKHGLSSTIAQRMYCYMSICWQVSDADSLFK